MPRSWIFLVCAPPHPPAQQRFAIIDRRRHLGMAALRSRIEAVPGAMRLRRVRLVGKGGVPQLWSPLAINNLPIFDCDDQIIRGAPKCWWIIFPSSVMAAIFTRLSPDHGIDLDNYILPSALSCFQQRQPNTKTPRKRPTTRPRPISCQASYDLPIITSAPEGLAGASTPRLAGTYVGPGGRGWLTPAINAKRWMYAS